MRGTLPTVVASPHHGAVSVPRRSTQSLIPRVSRPTPFRGARLVAALSLLAILALTLRPSAAGGGGPSTCVLCGERGGADLVLNILLFLPLGAAFGRLGWRPVLAAGMGLLLALGIEFAQLVIPGRSPTWRDVLLNAIGMGLGAWLARDALRLLVHRATGWLAAAAAVSAGLAIAVTGWLLVPQVKRNVWYTHINPRLGHLAVWDGQVTAVTVAGVAQTHDRVRDAATLQSAIAARAPIVISGRAGSHPARLAGLFAISDDEYEEMLLIGIEGRTLVLRERRRASTVRLFEPELRIAGFFDSLTPGREFRVAVEFRQHDACASLDGGPRRCAPRFAASSPWTLLLWRRWLGGDGRFVLGALTMFALALPVGILTHRATLRSRAAMALGLVALVWVGASLGGLAPPTWAELLLLIGGVAAGQPLGQRLARAASTVS